VPNLSNNKAAILSITLLLRLKYYSVRLAYSNKIGYIDCGGEEWNVNTAK
jgi:hypothetical protein